MRNKPTTIDEYLADLPGDKRAALEDLRRTIHLVVPDAEECISYQLPAFRRGKKVLVAFGAATSHCAFYPMSPAVVAAFQEELKSYSTSKGTIRFQPDNPLPPALIERLVLARAAENDEPA